MLGHWEENERNEVVGLARSAFKVLAQRLAALNAETAATAGIAAKARYGQSVTDAENALAVLHNVRAKMDTVQCDAAARKRVDDQIAAAQAVCNAKRAVYTGNTFLVTLKPNP